MLPMKADAMTFQTLSKQINSLGFKTVIVLILTFVVTFIFPLEAPEATQESAIYWLMNTEIGYILGWINQIVSMVSLSVVIAIAAWQVVEDHPLRAIISWIFNLMATMAFFIVKFINVWSVPLMAKALASGSAESVNAGAALNTLAPSVAFGFGPSLDYLGFALYAAACLMVWRPLYKLSTSTKVAAIGFLLFGVIYFLTLVAPYFDILGQADIEGWVLASALPLVIACVALFFRFKEQRNSAPDAGQE